MNTTTAPTSHTNTNGLPLAAEQVFNAVYRRELAQRLEPGSVPSRLHAAALAAELEDLELAARSRHAS